MDQINTPKKLISVVHFDTGDDIPLDYEKTSEFRHIEKLVKKSIKADISFYLINVENAVNYFMTVV